MKKTLFLLLAILFLTGLAMNIQYAVNDYGIKTNNLPNFVLANETGSTGTGGTARKYDCYKIIENDPDSTVSWAICSGTDDFPYPECPSTNTPAYLALLNKYCVKMVY